MFNGGSTMLISAPAVATIIDVHTHVVPASFPANPSPDSNTRWPCMCMRGADQAVIEFAGKAFRELDARSWDVTRRIDDMDRDGIAAQVLSPMPELLSYWFSPGDGLELARYVNQQIAEMMARAPRRLHGLGMVPMQDVELACAELARLKADGFKGVQLGSNINGVMPGDARFLPFYAECERLDMAVFVHALHPVGAERLKDFPEYSCPSPHFRSTPALPPCTSSAPVCWSVMRACASDSAMAVGP